MKILGIGTAHPELAVEQGRAAELGQPLSSGNGRRGRVLKELFARAGVRRRHSVLLQRGDHGQVEQGFFAPMASDQDGGPGTGARMQVYENEALELAVAACRRALEQAQLDPGAITDVVTVSCTGFYAPGLDVLVIPRLGLRPDVSRVHLGFMGCHGAFNALARASDAVRRGPEVRVLVAAVELCSLHYQYGWGSQRLVANALFADGAASFVCADDTSQGACLQINRHGSYLFPDSAEAMTWRIRDHGFRMSLSPEVPGLIRQHLSGWLGDWLRCEGLEPRQVRSWAVHPGGPRILTAFEGALELSAAALDVSRGILAEYGNMSSATIGFVLQRLLREGAASPGVAVGFGPGLVAEVFRFDRI